ncbi:20S proteasome subunit alpha 4 [Nematocida sp. ERTm5]|nr:20S proteasome subunit alpha 4 [Nematocida sp. AWRm79]KAI5184240.1 20S proteasome subunit alpha 4 [Nematocida sp. AWRm78]OAG32143.1 20S proteasome subunit alpha 4 [Nematocida sp. ERTm5]
MNEGFNRALSIFSPDGRIFQVEYAQLASERGSPVIFYSNGKTIAVAIEKRAESKHKVLSDLDKFKEVETGIYLTFAGIWPDSLIIIDKAVLIAREYAYRIGESIDILKLTLELSDYIQKYTITGGYRPFGVKVVLFGFHKGSSIISMIEPDGNYAMYKGGAIGTKSDKAVKELENITEEEPIIAVAKTLYNVAQKDANKMSLFQITPEIATILSQAEVSEIIDSFE